MLFGLFLASLLTMRFILRRSEHNLPQLGGGETKETPPEDVTNSVLALARAVDLHGKGTVPRVDPMVTEPKKRKEA